MFIFMLEEEARYWPSVDGGTMPFMRRYVTTLDVGAEVTLGIE
jgi:hypothetical protein